MTILLNPVKTATSLSTTTSTVAPGVTTTVDFVSATTISLKWLLTVENTTANKTTTYSMLVQNTGLSPIYTRSSIIGDIIQHLVNVDKSGGQLRLRITNNEGSSLTVHTIKILIY